MKRQFDAEPLKAQLAILISERERLDQAIEALRSVISNLEGIVVEQSEFTIDLKDSETTLHDAVRRACIKLQDGITRQRVIARIEREHPLLKPKPPSVAASLINLSKGEHPMLKVAIPGKGRSPSFYSTQDTTTHKLSAEEEAALFDEANTKGAGGWQSLFISLQRSYDKAKGVIKLTPNQRARIYHYFWSYGGGGWQDRTKRAFRRELPHLFT